MGPRPLHILATTDEGTRAALDTAAQLARPVSAKLVLIAPLIVSYGVPLERPDEDPAGVADRYRAIVSANSADAKVIVCCCHEPHHALSRLLIHEGRVVVGGRRSWWPTREERVARALEREGHQVTFAEVTNHRLGGH